MLNFSVENEFEGFQQEKFPMSSFIPDSDFVLFFEMSLRHAPLSYAVDTYLEVNCDH